ncbi:MAG: hypothetical protein WB947_01640 [Thermoplasmata archaeon]
MAGFTVSGVFPGELHEATSVFVAGTDRLLLKWVAMALLEPYSARAYWTDVRLEGEELEPDDPIQTKAIPADRLHVLLPRQLQQDETDARRAEAAAAVMLHADEPRESVRRIFQFLRLPEHSQQRIVSTFSGDEPAILVLANAQRLGGLYTSDAVAPMVGAIVDAGACIVVLWSEALPGARSAFDVILQVDGSGPAAWKSARIRCEKGLAAGPLAHGVTVRLGDLASVATVLDRWIPANPGR